MAEEQSISTYQIDRDSDIFSITQDEIKLMTFKFEDITAALICAADEKAYKSKKVNIMISTLNSIGLSLEGLRTMILNKEYNLFGNNPINETPLKELSYSLTDILDTAKPYIRKDLERLVCFMAQKKDVKNPGWLGVVAPPSSGKSYLLSLFRDPNISVFVDEYTVNGLAPGRPNVDAAEALSLFQFAKHKNLILNDMSSIISQNKDKVTKFIGAITTAFGEEYSKWSPGGQLTIECKFTLTMAMTPRVFKQQRKMMEDLGSRMLFLNLATDPDVIYKDHEVTYDCDELKDQIAAFIHFHLNSEEEVTISEDVDSYLEDFVAKIVILRNLRWYKISGMEGKSRLYNQLYNLAKTHALVCGRNEILIEDIDIFKSCVYTTVRKTKNLQELTQYTRSDNEWTREMFDSAVKLGIMEEIDSKIVDSFAFGKPTGDITRVPVWTFKVDWFEIVNEIIMEAKY